MKVIGTFIIYFFMFIQFLMGEMSSDRYKNKFGSFSSGGYAESLNYKSLNYIGQGFESGTNIGNSYDGYSGLTYFPMFDLYYEWSLINNDLTVYWMDYGSEYNILLTSSAEKTNAVPEGDVNNINLDSGNDKYTFNNVPDSKYLYFHIQAKDNMGTWYPHHSAAMHHKILSRQMLVLKYYEEEFQTFNILNKGTWRRAGIWGVNSDPVNSIFYLTNSGVGEEKIYIEKNTPTWKKYEYKIKLKKINGNNNVGIIFKMLDVNNYFLFKIQNSKLKIEKNTGEIIKEKNLSINLSNYVEFKIRVRYDENSGFSYLQVYYDDNKVFDMLYGFPIYGGVGVETDNCKIVIDKVIIRPIN